jgi:hypothetical protein
VDTEVYNGHLAEAAADLQLIEADLGADADGTNLQAFFSEPLHFLHHTWKQPFQKLLEALLVASSSHVATVRRGEAFLALSILPGVVSHCRHNAAEYGAPIRFLEGCLAQQDIISHLLSIAKAWKASHDRRVEARGGPPAAVRHPGQPSAERILAQIAEKMEIGRLSVAMAKVEQLEEVLAHPDGRGDAPRHMERQEFVDRVAALHPPATADDVLPPLDLTMDPEALVVTDEDLAASMASLNIDASSGPSGWTNQLLRTVYNSGKQRGNIDIARPLLALINLFLSGTFNDSAHSVTMMSRGVLIPKDTTPSSETFRPIGVSAGLCRLISKVAIVAVAKKVGALLLPFQLGVGISSGCETVAAAADAHMASVCFDPLGRSILSLDVRNAFNSIRRGAIAKGLQKYCPQLYRWFIWSHRQPSQIRHKDGPIVGYSQTGCRQGDPLAMLFFAVGFQSVLTELQSTLVEAESELRQLDPTNPQVMQPGVVMAYADDCNLLGSPEVLMKVYPSIPGAFGRVGLSVNLEKTVLLSQQPNVDELIQDFPEGLNSTTEGIRCLGRPIGTSEYVLSYLNDYHNRRRHPSRALLMVPPITAFKLLHSCILPRHFFLGGSINPTITQEIFRETDAQVATTVAGLAGYLAPDPILNVILGLPLKAGGLGLTHLVGPATEARYNLVLWRCRELHAQNPALGYTAYAQASVPHLQPADIGKLNVLGKDLSRCTEMPAHPTLANPIAAVRLAYSKATDKVYAEMLAATVQGKLLAPLPEGGNAAQHICDRQQAAFLIAASHQSTGRKWLRAGTRPGEVGHALLDPATYRDALRLSIGGTIASPPPMGTSLLCRCNSSQPAGAYSALHALSCQDTLLRAARTKRHNAVVGAVMSFVKRVNPGLDIEHEAAINADVRMDIKLKPKEGGGMPTLIDVTIVDCTQKGVINMAAQENWMYDMDAVTGGAEMDKRRYYSDSLAPAQLDNFVPFAIDVTGHLGPSARAFLERIGQRDAITGERHADDRRAQTSLLHALSTLLAIHHGSMLGLAKLNLLPTRQQV